ncbi:class I SAM-dependent methyltransferase [Candidatus Pacearchaeota archaeon]|nr:class I SAM-dependent methyltransferase [Candidatus Pacearchaeota archaeon]
MDYKEETLKVYDSHSDYFNKKFEEYVREFIKDEINEIEKTFPRNSKILDLGSGTGNHAFVFKQKNHDVLCLDISEKMLNKCKEKGLKTIKMDIEKLSLPKNSFDVVLAYTSLLHLPKSNVPKVIESIKEMLKDNGLFFISLKEGEGEGFEEFKEGGKRWFSLYRDDEIKKLLTQNFEIIKRWQVPINKEKKFLDYLCRKELP